jgi:hypothetical protein
MPPTADFKPFGSLSSKLGATAAAAALPTPGSTDFTISAGAAPMSTSFGSDPATPASVTAGGGYTSSKTPLAGSAACTPAATPMAAAAARGSWADVFLWRDPVTTVLLFVSGVGGYLAASWALTGGPSITPTSAVAYLLLAHLGLNFLRFFVSARWHAASMWEGSAWLDGVVERAVTAVRRGAALHDAYLSTKDPHVTLGAALALWTVAWLGTTFSARQIVIGAYLAAFSLPPLYAANRAAVDAQLADLHAATLGRLDRTEMPRTARLVALLVALSFLLVFSTWAQFAIGVLVAATYWRTTLAPAEVEAIRTAAAPLTHDITRSVRKVRARLSMVLDDARAMCGSTAGPSARTASRTVSKRD